MSAAWISVLFILVWILTFIPAWQLLFRLVAVSISPTGSRKKFWILFTVYRFVIALPYLLILLFYPEDLNSTVKSIIIGFVVGGLVLSVLRWWKTSKMIATLWWMYGFVYDGLNYFYPYRNLINLQLKRIKGKPKRVLDLGCGTGNVTIELTKKYPTSTIVGVDSGHTMLDQARKKLAGNSKVELIELSVEDFMASYDGKKFDLVIMSNVLYALDDRQAVFAGLKKVLKSGSKIILTNSDKAGNNTIIKEHLANSSILKLLHPKLVVVFIIDSLISQMANQGTFQFITQDKLEQELLTHGLKLSNIERCYGGPIDGVNILGDITHL